MNEKQEYDFSHISEAYEAIVTLYQSNPKPSTEEKQPLTDAIKDFYRTRTLCELFEIYDWSTDDEHISIHDYRDWLLNPFEREMESRDIWVSKELVKVYNAVLPDWSGKESLQTRVNGIQKKLDKIVSLLENFKITMSVKDALEM